MMRSLQTTSHTVLLSISLTLTLSLEGCEGATDAALPPEPQLSQDGFMLDASEDSPDSAQLEFDGLGPVSSDTRAQSDEASCPEDLPYASEVVAFAAGINAGYGQKNMPGVVLGPPTPGSPNSGSLDVLTLGVGGEIILGFGERTILNGPGADFIVWENAFWLGGDPTAPFAELGEVAVSGDGEVWHTFPCDTGVEESYDPLCAGWRARQDFDPCLLVPLDPITSGGDPFDLEVLGLEEVRFVRIRDRGEEGGAPTAGFDLDAIGIVHVGP